MIKKTWNDMTLAERQKARFAVFEYLYTRRLHPPVSKSMSNQAHYLRNKFKANTMDFYKLIGPDVADQLIVTHDGADYFFIEFEEIQNFNEEFIELLCFFTNTQPRFEHDENYL